MKLEMYQYNRLIEITGSSYNASKTADEDSVMMYETKPAIEDLITEYDVLQENYSDLKEKIKNKIEELEEHKFMIDMIDKWTDKDSKTWDILTDEIKILKGLLEK